MKSAVKKMLKEVNEAFSDELQKTKNFKIYITML